MTIRRGDRVKFLNDTGGGIVKEIKDSKMAVILIDDGFEVPVLISELVHVAGSSGSGEGTNNENQEPAGSVFNKAYPLGTAFENTFSESSGISDPEPSGEKPARFKAERNLLLGIIKGLPEEGLELWLINDSRFNIFYTVLQEMESSYLNIKTGHIEPDTKIFIRKFSREQINSFLTFRFQALFFMKGIYDPAAPSQKEYGIDPVEIYSDDKLGVNDFFDENAVIVPLISDAYEREIMKMRDQETGSLVAQKKDHKLPSSGSGRKIAERSVTDHLTEEVDLHIEELVESHSGLSGREVLDTQMGRFATALEGALRGQTKRIVFIHGIGNGKLKFEIRKTLDKKYPRLKYQDASFQEYGYGATMVIIRK